MKHLKLFKEGFQSSDYWWETDNSQTTTNGEFPWRDVEGITDEEVKFFRDNIRPYKHIDLVFKSTCFEIGFDQNITSGGYKSCAKVYFFQKKKDEWWEIQESIHVRDDFKMKWYKCDQWEGLVHFLQDKGLLKTNVIKESFNTEDYYTQISSGDEWRLFIQKHPRQEVTKGEENQLVKLITPLIKNDTIFKHEHVGYLQFGEIKHGGEVSTSEIFIQKLADEWWLLLDWRQKKSYKCDGWEGLLYLIEKLPISFK
jgi:hypothetical protein